MLKAWQGKLKTVGERYKVLRLTPSTPSSRAVWPTVCQAHTAACAAYLHHVQSTPWANWLIQCKMEEDPGERFRIKITVKQQSFFAADCIPSVCCFFWLLILNIVALTSDEIIVGPSPDSYSGMMSSVSVDSQLYFLQENVRMADYQLGNIYFSPSSDFCPYCYNYWRKQGFKLHTAYYGDLKHQLVYTIHLLLQAVMWRR